MTQAAFLLLALGAVLFYANIPFSTLHRSSSLYLSFSSQCQGCRQRHRLSRPTPLDLVRCPRLNDHFNHFNHYNHYNYYSSSNANNRTRRRHTQGEQDNCAGGTQQCQVNGSPAAAIRGLASTTVHVSRVIRGVGWQGGKAQSLHFNTD